MKVYLDFDRTLFNTKDFLYDLYRILEKYDVSLPLFDKIRQETKEHGFNCFNILEKIEKESSFNTNVYKELDYFLENDDKYIFDDCEEFLQYLKNHQYELIMLTKGNYDFQKKKIDYTRIGKYFDDIIITNKHKGELDINYHAIFIDDNMEEIESILKNNPVKVVYIDRYSNDKKIDKRFISVNSLKELYDVIK